MAFQFSLGPRLAALSAAVFLWMGIHLAFFPLFLIDRGLDAPSIGMVLATPTLVRIVATPFIMSLGDRRVAPASLLTFSFFGMGLVYLAMYFAEGFWALLALNGLAGLFQAGSVPLQDVILLREIAQDRRLSYGRLRAAGSFSFFAGSLTGGVVVSWFGAQSIALAMAIAALIAVPILHIQPRRFDTQPATTGARASGSANPIAPLATVLLVLGIGLAHASHAGINGFGTLNWQAQGHDARTISLLWGAMVVSEALFFFFAGAIPARLSIALGLLAVGAGVSGLRWLLLAPDLGLIVAFMLQALHGFGFGLIHMAGVMAIAMMAPAGRRSAGMGIATSIVTLFFAGSMFLSGRLYAISASTMYLTMAGIAALSVVSFGLAALVRRN